MTTSPAEADEEFAVPAHASASDESPASTPRPSVAERAPRQPNVRREEPAAARAADADLSGIKWTTSAPERSGMAYGRQPAVKGRSVVQGLPPSDPSRQPIASESPAAAPRGFDPPSAPAPAARAEVPRVDVEVKEVVGPHPGVDAARYRTAESPIARFASETPTAWDEEPKEYE